MLRSANRSEFSWLSQIGHFQVARHSLSDQHHVEGAEIADHVAFLAVAAYEVKRLLEVSANALGGCGSALADEDQFGGYGLALLELAEAQ